jgi:hypothetical protein
MLEVAGERKAAAWSCVLYSKDKIMNSVRSSWGKSGVNLRLAILRFDARPRDIGIDNMQVIGCIKRSECQAAKAAYLEFQ